MILANIESWGDYRSRIDTLQFVQVVESLVDSLRSAYDESHYSHYGVVLALYGVRSDDLCSTPLSPEVSSRLMSRNDYALTLHLQ